MLYWTAGLVSLVEAMFLPGPMSRAWEKEPTVLSNLTFLMTFFFLMTETASSKMESAVLSGQLSSCAGPPLLPSSVEGQLPSPYCLWHLSKGMVAGVCTLQQRLC